MQSPFLFSLQLSYNLQITPYLVWRSFARLIELIDSQLSWWAKGLRLFWRANRFLTSLCSLPLSKGLLSLNTPRTDDSAWMYWVRLPTASWLGTGNGPSLTPQTQQGFAEPWSHQLSKDLPSRCFTNSARICWTFTPQTQQGFAEPLLHKLSKDLLSLLLHKLSKDLLSLTPQRLCTQHQGLSVEDADSDSTTRYVQGTMTQCRRCWVCLHCSQIYSTVTQHRRCWVGFYGDVYTERGLAHLLRRLVSWSL